ncbi:hypothetical protein GCM10010136_19080 [Limoniibacter endophyticus]|uniref:N-acetyltransferase domain-containing protein n=1 Tax=Limoniibacter endophyticus TaxID=1565040 RepID=A0A8J3GGA6_9HYPH|nr:GNAT family N-acetyltransferase [Limoniibacter endophyticus]GHC71663.1 hypothetical protein GCM10010136_19080 [Limoniibacter endophyticus]
MSTKIRHATRADASSLAAVSIEVWLNTYIRKGVNAHYADYALQQFTSENFQAALSRQTERYLVSENEEGIDGYVCVSMHSPSPVDPLSQVEIGTLYVQPSHQGGGVGKASFGRLFLSVWTKPLSASG